MGKLVVLTLSVANSILRPEMTLQLVLKLPSGLSVSGEGIAEECSVQCSVTYRVPSGENKSFPLNVVANQVGSFDIEGRMEWYFGDDRTTYGGKSVSQMLQVVELVESPTEKPTVNLQATNTELNLGQSVILDLAALNPIVKPDMLLQLILPIPSGWSVSGAGFTDACSGLCTGTFEVPSGEQRNMTVEMHPNQTGSFPVEAEMKWYFGGDTTTLDGKTKLIEVNVHEPPAPVATAAPSRSGNKEGGGCVPGFNGAGDLALLGLSLLGLVGLGRRRTPWL